MAHFSTLAMGLTVVAAALTLVWAAVSDVRHYMIPNRIPVILGVGFLIMGLFLKTPFLLGGAATGALVLLVGAALFGRGLMGGGDVKLLAAMALWSGPTMLAPFALVTSLTGALLAAVMLSPLKAVLPRPPERVRPAGDKPVSAVSQPMPFGVAIAAGGLWVLGRYLTMIT